MACVAVGAFTFATATAFAGADGVGSVPQSAAVADSLSDALSARLFPVLSAAGRPDRLAALSARPELKRVLADRAKRRAVCSTDPKDAAGPNCAAQAMLWSDAETAALVAALQKVPGLERFAADDGLAAQVRREVSGFNTIVNVYALGAAPSYPQIDGPGIPADGVEAQARLRAALAIAQTPRAGSLQALDPSIEFGIALLDAHDRTDAIGFEPLAGGYNAPAMARAKGIDWSAYRYSAMIIPGSGPEVTEMPLSQLGKLHVRLAANRFARGDVAFIIVSGGRAHPRATRFAEAIEMRAALIERYGVPADAIVIEPYARHTTTNMRNAARLLVTMGAPLAKETLVVSNPLQSANIESALFAERNRKELGYEPGRIGRRLSPTELEFTPSATSVRVDPHDPLDP
ncbi:YdcF family protein [Sphingomonas sp. AP4-R1]|nr:YdcF family protein [Sphingomonas sp. AP4-R1]